MPLLRGENIQWREALLSEHHGSAHLNLVRILRKGHCKYVFRANEIDEFYDLEKDSCELVNEIDNPEYDSILWDLKESLIDVLISTNDPFMSTPLYTFCREVIDSTALSPADKDEKREKFTKIRLSQRSTRPPHGKF